MNASLDEILRRLHNGECSLYEARAEIEKLVELDAVDQDCLDAIAITALPAVLALCRDSQNNWDSMTVAARCYELADEFVAERARRRAEKAP